MHADCLEIRTTQPLAHLPSFETGWLACAGVLAAAALVISLLPNDAVAWVVAHLG